MTENNFKIEMLEFLMKNKTPIEYFELKSICGINVSGELFERYFQIMKNEGLLTWGGPPHKFSISDYGLIHHKLIIASMELDKKQAELIEIQRENLLANTTDIKKNPFRFRITIVMSAVSIGISTCISIYFANERAADIESIQRQQEKYNSELLESNRKVDKLYRYHQIKAGIDTLSLKRPINDSSNK